MARVPNPPPSYYQNAYLTTAITVPTLAQEFKIDDGYPITVWIYGTTSLRDQAAEIPIIAATSGSEGWSITAIQNMAYILAKSLGTNTGEAIAANQVGVPWQMFLVDQSQFPNNELVVTSASGQSVRLTPFPYPGNSNGDKKGYYLFINPGMSYANSSEKQPQWKSSEGCMSIPITINCGSITTTRNQSFTCTFYTLVPVEGVSSTTYSLEQFTYTSTFTEQGNINDNTRVNAANWVLQHEYDHLHGVLFIQKSTGVVGNEPLKSYLNGRLAVGKEGGVYQVPPDVPDISVELLPLAL